MQSAKEKAKLWLKPPFDTDTQQRVQELIDNAPEELEEAFYKDLSFGTGGLRGIMGDGTNRMNDYTVGAATQGLANYLNNTNSNNAVAIAFDSRNNSPHFAQLAANILSANGITVHLFEALRPTPQLSFAVRYLNCQAGIVITASHNPPEYNGYKVYWADGGQLIPPHDKGVIDEVRQVAFEDVNFKGNQNLIHAVGKELDEAYISALVNASGTVEKTDVSIVFTSIHGTGITVLPTALEKAGISNIHIVKEQAEPDGNFPTVAYPNPEEKAALQMAIDLANETGADMLFGTDPDADRIGVAARTKNGALKLLNGNQTAALLVNKSIQRNSPLKGNEYIAKTIVTSELLDTMAKDYGVQCYNTLTGFKWIADQLKQREGKEVFIGGGEESYGYLLNDIVRDKDAVMSGLYIALYAAELKAQGKTLWDALEEIYAKHGYYCETLVSITKKGKAGAEQIAAMMETLRNRTETKIGPDDIASIADYQAGTLRNINTNTTEKLTLPSSNVIQIRTQSNDVITARPSGTEPKIKFYFSVNFAWDTNLSLEEHEAQATKKIEAYKAALGI